MSSEVLPCPVKDACLPTTGNATNASSCIEGNEGPLCAVCAARSYRPSAFSPCEACGDEALAVLSALGGLVAMVACLVVFVLVNRRAPSGLLRPFINLVQQLTVMLVSELLPPSLQFSASF